MPLINYIQPDGTRRTVDVKSGSSVMEGAVRNNIEGIVAECGGACACATCHVYVLGEWADKVGEPNPTEASMLEHVTAVAPNSRLSCQIKVSEQIDGLVVRIADSQY